MVLGKSILGVGMDFEAGLSGVKAVSGATAHEMEQLKAAAIKAGEETKYSAVESARAIEELAKAGLTTAQILEGGLEGALVLATAGEISLADAAKIASTALNAFRSESLSVIDAANILAGAANASATDVSELKFGLSQVSAVASSVGLSFMDTSNALALLARNSIAGSDAGTSLKTMLMRLQPKTEDQIAAFRELGLLTEEGTSRFYDMEGSLRPLDEIAGLLRASMAHLTEAERLMALEAMFGSDAIRAANVLFKEGSEGATDMALAMSKIEAADTAAEKMNNLKGRLEEVSGNFETLKLKIFDTQKGAVSLIITKLDGLVGWLLKLDGSTLQAAAAIGVMAAATGPLLIGTGQMLNAMGSLVKVGANVSEALSITANASRAAGELAKGSSTSVDILARAFTALKSPVFLASAAIAAITVVIAEFTPVGDAAYAALIALAAGFAAYKASVAIQAVITGVTAAMAGQTLATNASTISIVAHEIAAKALAVTSKITAAATVASTGATGAQAIAVGVATATQWLWNAALSANPIGLVAAAVAALTAGVIALVKILDNQSEETKNLTNETNGLVSAQRELTDEIEGANKSFDANAQKMQAQNEVTNALVDEVIALSEEYARSGEGLTLLEAKIGLLNEAVPELALAFDKETDSLNMSSDAIRDKVDMQQLQIQYNEQLNQQLKYKEDEVRLESGLVEIRERREQIEKNLAEASFLDISNKKALKESLEGLIAQEKEQERLLSETRERHEELNPQIEATAEELQEMKTAMYEAEIATKVSAEELALQKKRLEEAEKAYEEYASIATNAFKRIAREEENAAENSSEQHEKIRREMIDTIVANTKMVDEWTANLKILEDKGLNFQFIDDLREAGPEAAGMVAAWVESSDEEISELNTVFETGTEVAIEAMKRQMGLPETVNAGSNMIDEIAGEVTRNNSFKDAAVDKVTEAKSAMNAQTKAENFPSVGNDMAQGVARGLDNGTSAVAAAGRRVISAAIGAMRNEADSHSPSRETMEVAYDMADGLVVGTEEKEGEVAEAGAGITEAYLNSLTEGFEVGTQEASVIMLGGWTELNQGLTDMVRSTGADRLQATIDAFDDIISETEQKNKELAKAEELAAKQRAVDEAESGKERLEAQKELNSLIAKNELEALKERQRELKAQLAEIVDAYEEMSSAITAALKEQYTQTRDAAKSAINDEYDTRKEKLADALRLQKEALDQQVENQQAATKEIIDNIQNEYKAKMKTFDFDEDSEISEIQAKIDALDAKTEQEERALKEIENQQRLHDFQQKITQAKTEEERLEAQKKYDEELAKQNRQSLLQQRNDEKKSYRDEIDEIKKSYKQKREAAKEQYGTELEDAREAGETALKNLRNDIKNQKETLDKSYADRLSSLKTHHNNALSEIEKQYKTLTQKERLEAEARKMMIDGDQQAIVDLLNKYTPDWGSAGRSAGEAFLNELQGVTPGIEAEVQRIMSLVNQAAGSQQQLQEEAQNVANLLNQLSEEKQKLDAEQKSLEKEQKLLEAVKAAATKPADNVVKTSAEKQQAANIVNAAKAEAQQEPGQQEKPEPQKQYVVQKGDTLSAIAAKYKVTITALREENGLKPEDDRNLQIGKILKIPVLHSGGISLKEQLALIDKNEAVAPLAELARMMQQAVISTANQLTAGFSQSIKNITNNTTNTNDYGINVTVNYQGEMNQYDVNKLSRSFAQQASRQLRAAGITPLGGR